MIKTDHEFEEGRSNHSDPDAGLHWFDIYDNILEVSPDDGLYSIPSLAGTVTVLMSLCLITIE